MSDPRQEERLRVQSMQNSKPFILPTQPLERVKLKLSPVDDELPFAQAVRQKKEMDKAAAAWRKRLHRD